jgi:hypothetical protein
VPFDVARLHEEDVALLTTMMQVFKTDLVKMQILVHVPRCKKDRCRCR